ncbi:MAG: hypothetical protein D6705_13300 [Deltaproteobacteria bacterium]|nr:MAG: hypothetical protein D6705_13300 [Deltaproteobacteria bacterium]
MTRPGSPARAASPPIDLRSDTVTRPCPEMRREMAAAEVGDDGWGDDPTVAALEQETAAVVGKPAALFVPSGTMANQIALRLHTRVGESVAAPEGAHIHLHESGGAADAGVQVDVLGTREAGFDAATLSARIAAERVGLPRVGLVWLENTLGFGGGAVWDASSARAVAAEARRHGRPVHLDGARLWNAAAACGIDEAQLAAVADTVSVCFSKGLGAPVGSCLCGPEDLVARARPIRQRLGGTMRQAGIVAAGALHALREHRADLSGDHRRAATLADRLRTTGLGDVVWPGTNMVLVGLPEDGPDAPTWAERLERAGVLVSCNALRELRFVTHRDVDDASLARAVERIDAALAAS